MRPGEIILWALLSIVGAESLETEPKSDSYETLNPERRTTMEIPTSTWNRIMQIWHVASPFEATVLYHRLYAGSDDAQYDLAVPENSPNPKGYHEDMGAASGIKNLVELILQLIIWYVYHKNVFTKKQRVERRNPGDQQSLQGGSFRHDICDCCEDCDTCILTFCWCRPCRIADTYLAAGLLTESDLFMMVPLFMIFHSCLACCYFPCMRTKLRAHLGGQVSMDRKCGGCCGCGKTTGEDFVIVAFCHLCSVIQEARAVDSLGGVKTTKFCSLSSVLPGDEALLNPIRIAQ